MEAEWLVREQLSMLVRHRGPRHGALTGPTGRLAAILVERGRLSEAEPLVAQAIALAEASYGAETGMKAMQLLVLGQLHTRAGRFQAADSAYRHALAIFRRDRAETHVDLRRAHHGLADMYDAWGKPAEAARHRRMAAPP